MMFSSSMARHSRRRRCGGGGRTFPGAGNGGGIGWRGGDPRATVAGSAHVSSCGGQGLRVLGRLRHFFLRFSWHCHHCLQERLSHNRRHCCAKAGPGKARHGLQFCCLGEGPLVRRARIHSIIALIARINSPRGGTEPPPGPTPQGSFFSGGYYSSLCGLQQPWPPDNSQGPK